jgi:hypothetical protein
MRWSGMVQRQRIRARYALLYISNLGRCHMKNAQVDILVLKDYATSLECYPGCQSEEHTRFAHHLRHSKVLRRVCRSRYPKADEAKSQEIMDNAPTVAARKIEASLRRRRKEKQRQYRQQSAQKICFRVHRDTSKGWSFVCSNCEVLCKSISHRHPQSTPHRPRTHVPR